MIAEMAIAKNAVLLFGLHFGESKSVRAIVLFKHGSPEGLSNFCSFRDHWLISLKKIVSQCAKFAWAKWAWCVECKAQSPREQSNQKCECKAWGSEATSNSTGLAWIGTNWRARLVKHKFRGVGGYIGWKKRKACVLLLDTQTF